MRLRRWGWLLVLLLVAGAARAEDPASLSSSERTRRSKAHFDLGRAHFNLGEFEAAMGEFEEGYRLKPLPLFLYNVAHSARRAGHPEKALEMFRRYLQVNPGAAEKKEVERAIAELEKELAARPAPVPQPEVVPPPPQTNSQNPPQTNPQNDRQTNGQNGGQTGPQNPPQTSLQNSPQTNPQNDGQNGGQTGAQNRPQSDVQNPPLPEEPPYPPRPRAEEPRLAPISPQAPDANALTRLVRPRAWYRDWLGWAITTVGAFAFTVGIIDFGVTYPRYSAYDGSAAGHTAQKYDDARSAATRLQADIAVFSIGAAVIAGGVVRFALVARKARRDRLSLVPNGLGLALSGGF
ncbi:MAG TPA: tetratricopeptide repeat protein [Polyangia bacterium]|nr:tetratricopeptide repeat protein [Polyangia bacterium]